MAILHTLKPSFFTYKYWQATFSKSRFSKSRFLKSLFRVAKSDNNVATLNPRQIYILPTRWGMLYAIMLLLLLVGSINYSISLGYYVTFLLASLGNMTMLHTWRNLVHLQATALPAQPVFAGTVAQVPIQVSDTKNRARYAIAAQFEDNSIVTHDIASNANQSFLLPLQTQQRGWQTLPRIKLHTEFPLLLFHAWAYVESSQQILIYPKPSDNKLAPPIASADQNGGNSRTARGDEDFDGHKTYQMGDAASRVDWKASSRGIGMFTKQYSGNGAAILLLDWQATTGLDFEARISQMARWVVDAHAAQQLFGLSLPNLTLQPNSGQAHYHQALQALALL